MDLVSDTSVPDAEKMRMKFASEARLCQLFQLVSVPLS